MSWKSRRGTGAVSPGDLIRMQPDAHCYYETTDANGLAVMIQSYATRSGARLNYQTLYCYTAKGDPVTLLKVTVTETGRERKKRGRKTERLNIG